MDDMRLAPTLILALLLVSACGPMVDTGLEFSDGTKVEATDGGGLAVVDADGRTLFALSEKAAPTLSDYTESASGPFAIWDFERTGELDTPLTRFEGAELANVGLLRAAWAAPGGGARLTVSITHGGDVTHLSFGAAGDARSLRLPVRCDPDGTFHGFGEQYDATDQKGHAFTLLVSEQGIGRDGSARALGGDAHTTYFPMPYYLDARGFGVLFETDHRVNVDLCKTDPEVAWFEVTSTEPLEVLVFHGPKPADVIRQLGREVGRPAALPHWAFDPWIGVQGGTDAVLAEADALDAAGIPVGALWAQDWTGKRPNVGGGWGVQYRWEEDPELYPDLAGMIRTLHQRGLRFLAYVNPFVDKNLPNHFPEMDQNGWLIQNEDGESYVHLAPNGESSEPDLTNLGARNYVKDRLRRMVTELGIDGWMADFGEWTPLDAVYADGSDPAAMHDRYPVLWHELTREVMESERPDGDWVSFARSGWTGVQGASQIHWVGDQEVSFSPTDGLPTVVPALLNLGLSAVPYVTCDIAGFSGGPREKEAWLRWTELGAFLPIMRTHEGNDRENNWQWDSDAETVAHFRRFARIHEALAPHLEALADQAQVSSEPIVRHLMLDSDDPVARHVDDEFLLGRDLLVAPVLEQGATTRHLWLPEGTWYHVWTGAPYEGPAWIDVDAPIGSPPVFSRDTDRADLRAIE